MQQHRIVARRDRVRLKSRPESSRGNSPGPPGFDSAKSFGPMLLLLLSAVLPAVGQVQEAWFRTYNGGPTDGVFAMALDAQGHSYVTGYSVTNNDSDFVTIKYASDGMLSWLRRYEGPAHAFDQPTAIAVNPEGDAWVTGISSATDGATSYATLRYDSAGNALWVRRLEGLGRNGYEPTGLAVDSSGNSYVAGAKRSGSGDQFLVAKYAPDGALLWLRYPPSTQPAHPIAMVLDAAGNVIVTGQTEGSRDLYDILTVKLDAAGTLLWSARYDGDGNSEYQSPGGLCVDASGNIYVTGERSTGFAGQFLTVKYTPAGAVQWVATYAGPAGESLFADAVQVDDNGNVYVTGAGVHVAGGQWAYDFATVKYDSSGGQSWAARYPWQNLGGYLWYGVLALDAAGNAYVGGSDSSITMKYSPEGGLLWAASRASAFGRTLTLDSAGHIFRAGQLNNVSPQPAPFDHSDFALIQYTQTDVPSQPRAFVMPARQEGVVGSNVVFRAVVEGPGPFTYQWRFNGQPITDATGSELFLSGVPTAAAGDYSVIVSNATAYTITPEARLVLHAPPTLTSVAQTNTVLIGESNLWTVTASGESPLSFQWLFNGVAIPGATQPDLRLRNVEEAASGLYTVVVSNAYGVAVSQPYRLAVIPPPLRLKLLGSWPGYERGPAYDVTVVSNRAYVAMGPSGFAIFDVSDPSRPLHLGRRVTCNWAERIEVADQFAYVMERTQSTGALEIFDVSNPAAPDRAGAYEVRGTAFSFQVLGRYAYVGSSAASEDTGALEIVDVSNPAQPVRVGYAGRYAAVGLRVAGGYAYTAALSEGLRVFDVRTPAQPVEVGAQRVDGDALGVDVAGRYAYVTVRGSTGSNALEILDVSEPASPTRVGRYLASGATRDVQVVGHLAYLVSLRWAGSRYVGDFQIVDVNDPANPVGVGSLQLEGYGTSGASGGLVVAGTHAFVASVGGWQAIDVSDPAHPTRVSGAERLGFAQAVRVVGHYAYLADSFAGLQVIDVSSPDKPVRVGGFETGGLAQDVDVIGDLAYVADLFQGLQVVNVNNPASPVRIGGYDTDGCAESPHALQVVDQLAYLAGGTPDLQVIDVRDPAKPVGVGGYPTAYAKAVQVVGDRAYVAGGRGVGDDYVGFFLVFDLSQATNPVPIGFTDTASYGYGLSVAPPYAYVVGQDTALTVVNISHPEQPVPVASYNTYGWAQAAQVVGNYLFLAGESLGLLVLDVSDPVNPFRVAQYPLGTGEDEGWDVQVVGNHAYLARGGSGLLVFEIAGPPILSITRYGAELVLRWNPAPGVSLQRTSSPNNSLWTDVPETEGQGSTRMIVGSANEFFRLRCRP